ncbi:MAG: UvrD-helicase domain-containing protein, partial [Phycisphaerales bacterium]|nr:UvrD-helicase domain-containing protein [Phycisphaerae bacterium]NNM25423.1 UvrD-helicase domain-containing protein [Phycisphaerales bacterium]
MPDVTEAITEGLTDPQLGAVTHVEGPLLVLAGPGSGKTTVVTRRVAHLIDQGIPAWQILALTFTNKAAGEMRERIDAIVPADTMGRRGLTVATFHAFCARLLRRYADRAGIAPRFAIYDSADQRAAIKAAIKAAELNERNFSPAAVAGTISQAKNRLLDAAGYAAEASDFYARSVGRAFTAYARILRENDAVDFDDLLVLTARLLQRDEAVRAELQDRYAYLLVDEYQDTNHAQFVIADTLASRHRNICVVGDPDQSIYGWRGADIRNILEFERHYPEATIVPLGQNFRSTGFIVQVADHLIQHNQQRKHKPLHTELGDGERPTLSTTRDERHEAQLVVEDFRAQHEAGTPWKEMAVLYRMNALSRVLEEAFRDAGVPYLIARGTAFYDRKEIKDALSYLRVVANPNDEIALRRIVNTPTRGIGKTTLDRVEAAARTAGVRFVEALRRADEVPELSVRARTAIGKFVAMIDGWRAAAEAGDTGGDVTPLADLVERVVRESGLESQYRGDRSDDDRERLENLEELINAAAQHTPAESDDPPIAGAPAPAEPHTALDWLESFLESVALVSDADAIDPASGSVTLMSLHAAKGLEFDAVALVGLEEGILPHHRSALDDAELEEERRLCFVGITRARRHLLLSRAIVRTHRGLRERTMASQFLAEMPPDAIIQTDRSEPDPFADDGWNPGGRGPGGRLAEFPVGSTVRHPKFGIGRVESISTRAAG